MFGAVKILFSAVSLFITVTAGFKFSADSFSEIDVLVREGKHYLESIKEKANVPQYGTCWKNAIAELQIGCKYLSENVQSDLALRFTDCFMQMSGLEPIVCFEPKDACLKKLSDRAFNAYVEFYTHTQSICYFLQSQVWHEEAEKTIDRLSVTSLHVSNQLEEAEKIQENLMIQQKESLILQHNLLDNGKNIASALDISKDKIDTIMKEFQSSTQEQRKALFELFEKLTSLKSWAMEEVSWLNSLLFYVSAIILAYIFTSSLRTQQARIYVFILLTLNYVVEQYIYSLMVNKMSDSDSIHSTIWLCRKVFIFLSILVTFIMALRYCDYNLANYRLLLEIRNQNLKILNQFKMNAKQENGFKPELLLNHKNMFLASNSMISNISTKNEEKLEYRESDFLPCQNNTPIINSTSNTHNVKLIKELVTPQSFNFNHDAIDSADTVSETSKRSEKLKTPERVHNGRLKTPDTVQIESHYNLRKTRSTRMKS